MWDENEVSEDPFCPPPTSRRAVEELNGMESRAICWLHLQMSSGNHVMHDCKSELLSHSSTKLSWLFRIVFFRLGKARCCNAIPD